MAWDLGAGGGGGGELRGSAGLSPRQRNGCGRRGLPGAVLGEHRWIPTSPPISSSCPSLTVCTSAFLGTGPDLGTTALASEAQGQARIIPVPRTVPPWVPPSVRVSPCQGRCPPC